MKWDEMVDIRWSDGRWIGWWYLLTIISSLILPSSFKSFQFKSHLISFIFSKIVQSALSVSFYFYVFICLVSWGWCYLKKMIPGTLVLKLNFLIFDDLMIDWWTIKHTWYLSFLPHLPSYSIYPTYNLIHHLIHHLISLFHLSRHSSYGNYDFISMLNYGWLDWCHVFEKYWYWDWER